MSLQAGQMKFRVHITAQIQLLRVCAFGKRADLFYDSGCPLALKNI